MTLLAWLVGGGVLGGAIWNEWRTRRQTPPNSRARDSIAAQNDYAVRERINARLRGET